MTGVSLLRTLVALRVRLLRHAVTRDVRTAAAVLGGATLSALSSAWVLSRLILLAGDDVVVAGVVTVGLGVTTTALWFVVTVLFHGDDDLDARRLALVPVADRRLATLLLTSSFVGALPVATVLMGLGTAMTWIGQGARPGLAIVAALCAALTPVVVARAAASVLAQIVASRRARSIGIVLLLAALPVIVALDRLWVEVQARPLGLQSVEGVAAVLAWVPPFSAWGVGWAAAEGHSGVATARLALALGTLLGAGAAHRRSTAQRMRGRDGPDGGGRPMIRQFRFDGTLGALVARRLCYWHRDRRHVVEAGMAMVASGMLVAVSFGDRAPDWLVGYGVVLCAYTIGAPMINETAMDGKAMQLGRLSGIAGTTDRVSRVLAQLAWSLPCTVLVSAAFAAAFADRGATVPGSIGLGVAVLAVTVGVGSLTSVTMPTPIPPDSDSPFAGSTGAGLATLSTHLVASPVTLAACVPILAAPSLGVPAEVVLLAGPLYGLAVLAVLVRVAGWYVDHRGARLFRMLVA